MESAALRGVLLSTLLVTGGGGASPLETTPGVLPPLGTILGVKSPQAEIKKQTQNKSKADDKNLFICLQYFKVIIEGVLHHLQSVHHFANQHPVPTMFVMFSMLLLSKKLANLLVVVAVVRWAVVHE